MPTTMAHELIKTWQRFPVQSLTLAVLNDALRIHIKHKFSYWDCAVIAAAKEAGCNRLLTEDLTHGQIVEGLTIVNPFAAS